MSLLLQALQNAAKNRDEKGAKAEAGSADDANLQLEPLAEPHLPADSPSGSGLTSSSTASPEYAAGVMRANSGVQYSMVDWARERFDAQIDLTKLTRTTRLFLVSMMPLCGGRDGLEVSNRR